MLAAAFTPVDGQADPQRTSRAFAAAATRHGAVFTRRRADSRVIRQGEVVGVMAGSHETSAGQVVVAAGSWSSAVCATAGVELPVRLLASQMLLSEPAPRVLLPTVTAAGRVLSLKQLPDGRFLIGGGRPADIDVEAHRCRIRTENVEGNWADASAVLPAVAASRLQRSCCGLEAQSFDGVPLIGPLSTLCGLYLAIGFSNHGFQLSVAVGKAVAEDLCGARTPELDPLRAERMFQFDSAQVSAFKRSPFEA